MNNTTIAKNRQASTHDLNFVNILNEITLTEKAPDNLTPVGPWQEHLDNLVEALDQDGMNGFLATYRVILKKEPRLQALLATIEDTEQEELHPDFTIGKNGKKVFKTLSEDDVEDFPDVEYLVSGMLQTASVSLDFGESNTGKTSFALDIAEHVARGITWLGRRVKQGKVLYIYAESRLGLKPRILAWKKHHNVGSTPNLRFITRPVQLVNDREMLLDTIAEQEEIPALIVIDTFSNCAIGTNQNDQAEVFKVLNTAHEIVREYGCHVKIVHHTNKSDTANGSQAFKNHVDTQIKLSRADKHAPIVVSCEKQRDADLFNDITIELQVVNLYTIPETLEQVSACVVVASDTLSPESQSREIAQQAAAAEQETMLNILAIHGKLSSNSFETKSRQADVPVRSFNKHIRTLVNTRQVIEIKATKKGSANTYMLAEQATDTVEPGTPGTPGTTRNKPGVPGA